MIDVIVIPPDNTLTTLNLIESMGGQVISSQLVDSHVSCIVTYRAEDSQALYNIKHEMRKQGLFWSSQDKGGENERPKPRPTANIRLALSAAFALLAGSFLVALLLPLLK